MRFLQGLALVLAFGVGAALAAFGAQPLVNAGLLPQLPDRATTEVAPLAAVAASAEVERAAPSDALRAAPLQLAAPVNEEAGAESPPERAPASTAGAAQLAEALRITRGLLDEMRASLDETRSEADALRAALAEAETDRRRLTIALTQARAQLGLPPLPAE